MPGGRGSSPRSPVRSFRPSMRTSVRLMARRPPEFGRGGPSGGRRVAVVHGGPPPPGHARRPAATIARSASTSRRSGGSRSTTSIRTRRARRWAASRFPSLRSSSRARRITAAPEGAPLRRRAEGAPLRALRPGRDWHGRRMALVLDHVNGVHDDHRLENLRICARTATRRSTRTAAGTTTRKHHDRACLCVARCSSAARGGQRYCSASCPGAASATARAQAARRASSGRRTPGWSTRSTRSAIRGRRPAIRRQRQRDPQVAPRVRGRSRRDRRGRPLAPTSLGARRPPPPS